ncbi:aldehyde dehydrogenase family protein [Pseudoalteromonas tunicata]|nr:aldehyde dehydrogenase family protein [Pseudoalteromonas tunicata]ATC93273.1 hypothetical protein PTUN_a0488 [Pseudoalteromonas tunicata]AXT32330.1 aldehyde dehydrogenase family protein [Pseudoalteromonas tunicata]
MELIDLILPQGTYTSAERMEVCTLQGEACLSLSMAPSLMLHHAFNTLEKASNMSLEALLACIYKAGDIFVNDILAGQSPKGYVKQLHAINGLAESVILESLHDISSFMKNISNVIAEQKHSAGFEYSVQSTHALNGTFHRKFGTIFTCILPGNHPGVNTVWLNAMALGYKVLLKPSSSDPITSYRLILSLQKAGMLDGQVSFIPGKREINAQLVELSKEHRLMFFGGQDIVDTFGSKSGVIVRGPGYSKLWLEPAYYAKKPNDSIDSICRSIVADGGIKCTNLSQILVNTTEDGFVNSLHASVNASLGAWFDVQLQSSNSQLCVYEIDRAKRILNYIATKLADSGQLNINPLILLHDFEDGTATIRPWVFKVTPGSIVDFEVPAPIALLQSAQCESELRNSLSLSVLSNDNDMFERLAQLNNIRKLLWCLPTTYSTSNLPHDGALYEQLFEKVGIARSN